MRRVVVTGMGCLSPIGNSVDETWKSLKEGKCGISTITRYDNTNFKVKYAAEVKDFDADKYMDPKAARKMAMFSKFAVAAAKMALDDASLTDKADILENTGIYLGVGIGGLEVTEAAMKSYFASDLKRMPPLTIPELIPNEATGNISITFGIHGGSHTIATACASGTDAIGDALDQVRAGRYDVVLAGGAESTQCGFANLGFTVLQALSSKWENEPQKACRPFDKQRDGFIMGEGATILVLEEYEHAKARGAKIYAEVAGYGASTDGYNLTAPNPDGITGSKCMIIAMKDAGVKPEEVQYYNAHGTSTHLNDAGETQMLHLAFGDAAKKLHISSTKSMTGHCLGAAAGIETALCCKLLEKFDGRLYPNIYDGEYDTNLPKINIVDINQKYPECKICMCNSFGFGGTNAIMILGKSNE